jgi:hypothetical protein
MCSTFGGSGGQEQGLPRDGLVTLGKKNKKKKRKEKKKKKNKRKKKKKKKRKREGRNDKGTKEFFVRGINGTEI